MTDFNALTIIWINVGEKQEYSFVSLSISYSLKGVISFNDFITEINELMIIWVKNGDKLVQFCVTPCLGPEGHSGASTIPSSLSVRCEMRGIGI